MTPSIVNAQLQRVQLQLNELGFSEENKSDFMDVFSYAVTQIIINEVIDTIGAEEVDAIVKEADSYMETQSIASREDFDHLEFLLECLEKRYMEFSTQETPLSFELIVENSLQSAYEILKEAKRTLNSSEEEILEEIKSEMQNYLLNKN